MTTRHPNTEHWQFPPADRAPLDAPLQRTNLRELEARPGRFEHHLMSVGSIGPVQLEVATASEPLYFAHRNISDEYALPLTTGDAMSDSFPFRTFLSSFDDHKDVGRINHKVNQVVLHPYGFLHWPGRLRPPYKPFEFAPGMRRCGMSVVMCSAAPTVPEERPLFLSAGCESGPKQYGDTAVPFMIADVTVESDRVVARVGECTLQLVVSPESVAPERGGYVLVVEGQGAHFPGDLIYVPAGATLSGVGVGRALVFSGDTSQADAPPATWSQVPDAPFPVYEEGVAESLPLAVAGIEFAAAGEDTVSIAIGDDSADVPRYWLARFLFRLGLHQFRLGYLESYGGFYYDDADDVVSFGIRAGGKVSISRADAAAVVERIYRAVAPSGYVERLT